MAKFGMGWSGCGWAAGSGRFDARIRRAIRRLVALVLFTVCASPVAVQGNDAAAGPDPFDEATPYAPRDAGAEPKNPFVPLIEAPLPVVVPPPAETRAAGVREVPPLPLSLVAVVGNDAKRLALLELNGTVYEMASGEAEPGGLFKVVEIRETAVVVHDGRLGKNRVVELK